MLVAAFITIPICLVLWVLAMDRVVQNHPIVPAQPRQRVPWTVIDMAIIGLGGVALLSVSSGWNRQRLQLPDAPWRMHELQPDQQISLLTSFSVVAFVVLLVAILICRLRAGATLRDLGFDHRFVLKDFGWGVAGFVMLIVPMLLMHLLAQLLIQTEEAHPFIEMLRKDPRTSFLLPIAIATMVVAPLTEEFFFRVLLQGWLERVAVAWERAEPLAMRVSEPPAPPWNIEQIAEPISALPTSADSALPDASASGAPTSADANRAVRHPPADSADTADSVDTAGKITLPNNRVTETDVNPTDGRGATTTADGLPATAAGRLWPIVASSLLFALAHVGQGPAPISLFFLALGLGYIYQRTHRILPSLVIHMLVNTTAMAQLWQMVRAAN